MSKNKFSVNGGFKDAVNTVKFLTERKQFINSAEDFCDGAARGTYMVGSEACDPVTRAVYDLITHSADVVKGIFAGHFHSDIHLEIRAQTPDGTPTAIPQFISTALAYGAGHMMRIRVC